MSEWNTIALDKMAEEITVGFVGPMSSEYIEQGIPFLRSQNVIPFLINYNGIKYITEKFHKKLSKSSLKPGDVVIVRTGKPGASAVIPKSLTVANCSDLVIVRCGSKLDPNFVSYFINSITKSHIDANLVGAVQQHFNVGAAKKILIPDIDIAHQYAISTILCSLDDKIDLLHRQNATLEAMAETLFREWFVEEANTDSISQLVYIQNGYAFKSKDFKENGSNGVVKIKNISGGIIDIKNTDFIDDGVAKSVQNRFKILTGDILIAMTGAEIGKLGIIPKTDENLWLNQRVGLLREKFHGSKYLAYLQLKSDFGQDYIENTATGSAQPNISGTGIENCGFPRLPEEKIKEYSLQIGELYEKVIFNLGQIRTLTALRDTLLPKLMSGEVRITEQ